MFNHRPDIDLMSDSSDTLMAYMICFRVGGQINTSLGLRRGNAISLLPAIVAGVAYTLLCQHFERIARDRVLVNSNYISVAWIGLPIPDNLRSANQFYTFLGAQL